MGLSPRPHRRPWQPPLTGRQVQLCFPGFERSLLIPRGRKFRRWSGYSLTGLCPGPSARMYAIETMCQSRYEMDVVKLMRNRSFLSWVRFLVRHRRLRHGVMRLIERKIHRVVVDGNPDNRPVQVQKDVAAHLTAILHSFDRTIERGLISRHVRDRWLETLLDNVFCWEDACREAERRLGFRPPLFVLVSPGKRCNLCCTGCYACSDAASAAKLDWASSTASSPKRNSCGGRTSR